MAKAAAAHADFGSYLKKLSAENGYSQAELARAAKVNQTQISRAMENVTTPSLDTLRKIAPLLNVRLGDLMIRAGLATATELGTTGAPPPPLPPIIRELLALLSDKSPLTEKEKRMLQAKQRRSLEDFLDFIAHKAAEVAEAIARSGRVGRR